MQEEHNPYYRYAMPIEWRIAKGLMINTVQCFVLDIVRHTLILRDTLDSMANETHLDKVIYNLHYRG